MNFTPEEYAIAGQFIIDNLNDPEKIALTAAQFGLKPEDFVYAAQAVGQSITANDALSYFDNAGIDYQSLTTYSPEQYAAAGQYIAENFSDPNAIATAADTFNLTIEQVTVAARTVDPTITVDQVQGYFQAADIGYETANFYFVDPATGLEFDTRAELDDFYNRQLLAYEQQQAAAALEQQKAAAAAAAAAAEAKAAQDRAAATAAQAARDAAARAKAAADAMLAAEAKAKADAAASAKVTADANAKAAAETARIAAAVAKAKADLAAAEKAASDAAAKAKAGLIPQAEANKLREVFIVEANKLRQLEAEATTATGGGTNLLPILLAVGAYFLIGG